VVENVEDGSKTKDSGLLSDNARQFYMVRSPPDAMRYDVVDCRPINFEGTSIQLNDSNEQVHYRRGLNMAKQPLHDGRLGLNERKHLRN